MSDRIICLPLIGQIRRLSVWLVSLYIKAILKCPFIYIFVSYLLRNVTIQDRRSFEAAMSKGPALTLLKSSLSKFSQWLRERETDLEKNDLQ